MKVEALQPSGDTRLVDGLAVELAVCIRDERNVPVPGATVKWAVHGHEHQLEGASTIADETGVSHNRIVVSPGSGLGRGTITVQTPDSHIYQIGSFFVIAGETPESGRLMLHPCAAQLIASPPAHVRTGVRAAGNTLKIYYPGDGVKLAWGAPQYAWALYQDSSGNPLKNQTLIPTGDSGGNVYINPADPKPVTDDRGWAAIKVQVKPALGDNPPFAAQDVTGTLFLQSQSTPGDQTQASITFSTTMGGRGYLTLTPAASRIQGYWWPVKLAYRHADGTPCSHRQVNWANVSAQPGGLVPISYSTTSINPPSDVLSQAAVSYTDEKGESTLYICTNDGYGGTVYISLLVSADNVLLSPGDGLLALPIDVAPRPTPASLFPTIRPNSGTAARRPNEQIAVQLSFRGSVPALEGRTVTWGSADSRVTISRATTTISNGVSQNWITGVGPDSMYTASIYADTGYPPNAPERAYFTQLFVNGIAANMNRHFLNISPANYQPLPQGTWQTFTVQDFDYGTGPGQPVRWFADPPDNIQFKQPYPTTMDGSGKSSIQLQATGLSSDTRISIRAEVYNPSSGGYDTDSRIYTFLGQVDNTSSIVINPVPSNMVLYTPYDVSATFTRGKQPVQGASIQWASFPSDTLSFSPNIKQTDGSGTAKVSMTAYGPNEASQFTVVASYYDTTTQETVAGSLDVNFAAAKAPPPENSARLAIESLEGDMLVGTQWHILQASYLFDDGRQVTGKNEITWSVPDNSGVKLAQKKTWTDANGVTTNAIHGPAKYDQSGVLQVTVQASADNPLISETDSGSLSLILTATNVEPSSKVMTITVNDTQPIQSGYACPISVKYTQPNLKDPVVDAPITWAVYPYVQDSDDPPYELTWGYPNPTHTGNDGISNNTITYNGTKPLDGAVVVASSFNPVTGQMDYATQSLNFVYTSPMTGIMINRPWAMTPDSGQLNKNYPCQFVTAKMTLANGQKQAQILLKTVPYDPGLRLFYADNTPINPMDEAYTVSTQNGSAEIRVAAIYPYFFTMQAYYPPTIPQPDASTTLWLTALGGQGASTSEPMTIENLDTSTTPPVLKIPDKSTWPNPFFTVGVPIKRNEQYIGLDLLILLNYRVIYKGTLSDVADNNIFNIAYAALQPSGNVIAYFLGSGPAVEQKGYLTFDATGTAQTYPYTGTASQTLTAPSIVPALSLIQASDIVNGLTVRINPASTDPTWSYQAGDKITVYYYLSGQYPLPTSGQYCPTIDQPARNVAYSQYTVQAGDALTQGQPLLLEPLPQALLAGYGAAGTLVVNFKVQRDAKNFWSKSGTTIRMNTVPQ